VYLWDANILRAYVQGHSTVVEHTRRATGTQIVLPSVVVAEALRGRCEFLLKAKPEQVAVAEKLLQETLQTVQGFQQVAFDDASLGVMQQMLKQHQSRKRYADLMIAAIAKAGQHILVTRNTKDFADLLPKAQLQNWIDDAPTN
jgi:predicted nucleic acid-binding protein